LGTARFGNRTLAIIHEAAIRAILKKSGQHLAYASVFRFEAILKPDVRDAILGAVPRLMATRSIRTSEALQRDIRKMVNRIVRQFHPDRIILFGSHARGNAGPDSDVDLLVVMPVKGLKRKKAIEIGVALHDIRVPKDIIVTTQEEFEWRKEIVGTIEYPAVEEGTVLYTRT
jgi:uncharacterized protein